jgi:hypothetical protein
MLDPIIHFFTRIFEAIGRGIGWVFAILLWPFMAAGRWYAGRGWILRAVLGLIILGWLGMYAYFTWQTQRWVNFNPDYVAGLGFDTYTTRPGSPVEGQQNQCGKSATIDAAAFLVDFNVNQNHWVPSMLASKMGFFGVQWKYTPFFDNKAAFQLGVNEIIRRTAQEGVDRLGRVRGTSQINQSLQNARENIYYKEDLWYFSFSPFGFTTPTPTRYREAVRNFAAFNADLVACRAVFDPRADNLLRFFEQMSSTIGSTSDILNDQIRISDAGWFDPRADDRFWFAYGQLYALNGIMAGARTDFRDVVTERNLTRTWDELGAQLRSALNIRPLIISNGDESAFMMPSHLATMGFNLLRVRANITEMRDILDR